MKTLKLIKELKYQKPNIPVTVVFENAPCKDYYITKVYERTIGNRTKNVIILKGGNMTKKKTVYRNYDELCHEFTVTKEKIGRVSSNRMHWDGNVMYSYYTPIAKKYQNKGILVIDRNYCGYSVSTSNHIWALKQAFNHWTIIYSFGITNNLHQTLQGYVKFFKTFRKMYNFNKKFDAPACDSNRLLYKSVYKDYKKLSDFLKVDLLSEEEHKDVDLIIDNIKKLEEHNQHLSSVRRQKVLENCKKGEDIRHNLLIKTVDYIYNEINKLQSSAFNLSEYTLDDILNFIKNWISTHEKELEQKFEHDGADGHKIYINRNTVMEYVAVKLLNIDISDFNTELYMWKNPYDNEDLSYRRLTDYREGYPKDVYSIGNYIKVQENGELITNSFAHVQPSCSNDVYLMALYYLNDNYSLADKKKRLINRHCGSFVIRTIEKHYVQVGCHTFLKPILQQFVKDYSKFLKKEATNA